MQNLKKKRIGISFSKPEFLETKSKKFKFDPSGGLCFTLYPRQK